jgi:hypothetical protein
MTRLVLLVAIIDGGPPFTPEAIALITGDPAAKILAARVGSIAALPLDWVRAARRRPSEACAVIEAADALMCLRFWAAREFNVELVTEDDGLNMPGAEVPGA